MTEPDFAAIASRIEESIGNPGEVPGDAEALEAAIVESLRQVWNARGASDIAKIESELSQMMGASASGPYIKNLDRALRKLDR